MNPLIIIPNSYTCLTTVSVKLGIGVYFPISKFNLLQISAAARFGMIILKSRP
jgi:hypothetical protein